MLIVAEDLRVEERNGESLGTSTKLLEEEQMHGEARIFARILLKPGAQTLEHQHLGTFEAFYILNGKAIVNDNGMLKQVKTGDVVFTDDGECHSIKNIGEADLEYIALVINTK